MSLLVIQLPPRDRLGARAGASGTADATWAHRLPTEWHYVLSSDGRTPAQTGQASATLLPRADQVLLLLADADVSWHRIDIPKAPPARLRDALAGVMEEALLDEGPALHFALAEGAVPGRPGWVAVTDGPRLAAALSVLEAAGQGVERVVTAALPADTAGARGHFHLGTGLGSGLSGSSSDEDSQPWLSLSRPDGVLNLRLGGNLARAMLPGTAPGALTADVVSHDEDPIRWTSTPAAAQAAEAWLGQPVPLMSDAERALEAAQGRGNLRQFDLVARARGTRALRTLGKRFFSADWRPVRIGLAALLVLQLVGLNAYAWQQRQAIEQRRTAMNELLRSAHPGVRAVLDAPLQMQRETDRLRTAAGRAGDGDLEALMAAAAAAWPDGLGPTQTLRFEPGNLTLATAGWGEPQIQQFRERLRSAGYAAEFAEGRVVLTRLARQGVL